MPLYTLARAVSFVATLCIGAASAVAAQAARDTAKSIAGDSTREDQSDITPGAGLLVARTDFGTLRISVYALVRYINQLPDSQTFVDHLGQIRNVDPRQDFQFHRVMVHFLGWMYLPKLSYTATVWTVNSTEQVRVVGSLSYRFGKAFHLSGGINGIPGTRSLNGSHPLWLAPDRVMADEYFRPGFTQGIRANGALPWRLNYAAMVGNNISQLGVNAGELTRDLAKGVSLWWLPTTGEFGPKGGFGDYDWHEHVATRFGTSFTRSREDRASQVNQPSPDNTQIRMSDGVLLFETGALAPAVTVRRATYTMSAVDLGFKYRGMFLQGELYHRWLTDFEADGPIPIESMYDRGYYIAGSYYPIRRKLETYLGHSHIDGAFNTSWEIFGGANWYPADTRWFRMNLHVIRVERSSAGSTFGYYLGGMHGTVVSLASYVLF